MQIIIFLADSNRYENKQRNREVRDYAEMT